MQAPFGLRAAIAAFLSATTASAAALSTCASGASDICYAVGVPSTTADSSTGNIYLQLSAPTTYSWVALGVGTQEMAGANMFIMYTDGTGNVTVSSRQGEGNTQPQYSASTASDLHLLAGSGVSDDVMVANILCSDCKTWSGGSLSTSSTSSVWIGAWKAGSALDSTSPSESISIHDEHTSFELDLTQATLTADSNPFTSAVATDSGSTTGVTQGATPSREVIWAHGLGMAIVFAILYPMGSGVMPLLGKWWLHAGWQSITWLGMWAFFGLGVLGAQQRSLLFNNTHTTWGTVIVSLLGIQPALGSLHHLYFRKHGSRGMVSFGHLWWGRSLIVMGAINAGLGLELSHASNNYIIAYSLVAVVMYLAYAVVKWLTVSRQRRLGGSPGGKISARTGYIEQGDGDDVPMRNYGERQFINYHRK